MIHFTLFCRGTNWNLSFNGPTEAEEACTPVGNTSKNDGDTVNGKADCVPLTPSDGDLMAEDDDEDDQGSPTGNESVGKKLWIFFTT